MMKKLAKATLFAAVAAFLLAGFPACSSDDDDDPTLTGIEIKVDDSKVKTTYTVGEAFDPEGITVMATYSDGSTKDVTDDAELKATCNGEVFTTAAAGNFEVTLTATHGGKTASTTCKIEVKASDTTGDGTGQETPTNYSFSLEELIKAMTARLGSAPTDNAQLAESDFTGDNAFLKLLAEDSNNKYRTASSGCFEIKNEAISVTFKGTGTLSVGFASTGASNVSSFALKAADGSYLQATSKEEAEEVTIDSGTAYTVKGTAFTTISYTITKAGTYTFCAAVTSDTGRNTRINSVEMKDTVQ